MTARTMEPSSTIRPEFLDLSNEELATLLESDEFWDNNELTLAELTYVLSRFGLLLHTETIH